jgi:hypothetical protein
MGFPLPRFAFPSSAARQAKWTDKEDTRSDFVCEKRRRADLAKALLWKHEKSELSCNFHSENLLPGINHSFCFFLQLILLTDYGHRLSLCNRGGIFGGRRNWGANGQMVKGARINLQY